jgi:hypothetical protein
MSEVTKKSNGMATASLILGIISIVTGFFGWLGIICGLLAIIFAIVAKNKIKADPALASSKGAATGGLVTGIIGLLIGIAITVIAIMFVAAVAEGAANSQELRDLMNQ